MSVNLLLSTSADTTIVPSSSPAAMSGRRGGVSELVTAMFARYFAGHSMLGDERKSYSTTQEIGAILQTFYCRRNVRMRLTEYFNTIRDHQHSTLALTHCDFLIAKKPQSRFALRELARRKVRLQSPEIDSRTHASLVPCWFLPPGQVRKRVAHLTCE